MASRDLVIQALLCGVEHQVCADHTFRFADMPEPYNVTHLMEDALVLLKAQEPKPPIITTNSYGWKFYHCPSCGEEFYQNNKAAFCDKCGQAVKWE